jgi:hypothetical protein
MKNQFDTVGDITVGRYGILIDLLDEIGEKRYTTMIRHNELIDALRVIAIAWTPKEKDEILSIIAG